MNEVRGMKPVNPYSAGPMVTTKGMFFGRETELRQLRSNILNMNSCSIVGLRRIGKSSLLYYLSHHEILPLEQKFLFAYLDLQEKNYHTLKGLLNGAFHQWMQGFADGKDIAYPSDLSEFTRSVRRLREQGYSPVLCLDEFENLIKRSDQFGDDTFETWRALANAKQVVFVTSSLLSLADLIESEGLTSSFYNVFYQLDLGLLDKASAHDLLTIPMTNQGLAVPVSAVNELLELCGYYPYYLQMGAFHFCDALTLGTSYDIRAIKHQTVQASERHWKGLWQSLSSEEQQAFIMVLEKPNKVAVSLQLRNLERKGLISSQENGFKPFGQGFSSWVCSLPKETATDKPEIEPTQNEEPSPDRIEPPASAAAPILSQANGEEMNIKLLLVATVVTLIVLVVAAWVLTSLLEIKSVGSLMLILVIAFPFILVLVGKLTGTDFVAWLGSLFQKKQ